MASFVYLILLVLFLFKIVEADIQNTYFIKQHYNCGEEVALVGAKDTVQASSRIECQILCSSQKRCKSTNYNRNTKECQLNEYTSGGNCSKMTQAVGFTHYESVEISRVLWHLTMIADANGKPGYINLPNTKSCYSLKNDSAQWHEAETRCKSEGGHLACPNTLAEFKAIRKLVQAGDRTSHVWSGLNDQDNEGKFVCADGSKVQNNAADFFGPNEPNNMSGNEHCAPFAKGKSFMLNDNKCDLSHKILCEITEP